MSKTLVIVPYALVLTLTIYLAGEHVPHLTVYFTSTLTHPCDTIKIMNGGTKLYAAESRR